MMDVEGRPRVVHTVSSYIDYSKDKQGFTQVGFQFSTSCIISFCNFFCLFYPHILTTAKTNRDSHRFWFSIFEINKFNESLVEMSMWTASPDSPDSWTWISNQPDQLLNFRQASDFPLGSRSTPSPQLLSQIFYLQVVIRLWSSSLFSFAKSAASSGSVPINFQCWKIRFNLWNKQSASYFPIKSNQALTVRAI